MVNTGGRRKIYRRRRKIRNTGRGKKNAIHDAAKDMQYVPRAKNTHYVPRAKNTQYVKRLKNSVIRAATVKYRIREATIIVRNKYCNTQYLRRQ